MQDLERNGKRHKLNLQLGGFKSSILDSCKTPKVSITAKLQIAPAPVDKLSFFSQTLEFLF